MTDAGEKLDRMLAAPLSPVADAGFSARVAARIAMSGERSWLPEAAVLGGLALLVSFAASTAFARVAAHIGYDLATSLPLATAALMLALTLTLVRFVSE